MAETTPWATRPPLAQSAARPGYPAGPPLGNVHPEVQPESTPNNSSRIKRTVIVAGVAVAFAAGAIFVGSRGGEGQSTADRNVPENIADVDLQICPDGIYPNGPFAATEAARGTAKGKELHRRPEVRLQNHDSYMKYLLSSNGVACESSFTSATLTGIVNDILGGGEAGAGYGSTDINGLAKTYRDDKETALLETQQNATLYDKARVNEERVTGPKYKVEVVASNDENKFKVVFVEFAADIPAGEAYTLTPEAIQGDGSVQNDKQIAYINRTTGQIYVEKALAGAEVIEMPKEEKAKAEEQEKEQNGGEGSDHHGEESTGGSSTNSEGEQGGNNGETDGCNGSCGTEGGSNGGGGSTGGGGGNGGGCGGGCGGGGGTPGTTPGTNPPVTNPPVTQPPATTQPSTPTTRPPQITTTTRPPSTTTTTRPKGTDPGCQAPAPCE